jgi:hypothetical protein
MKMSKHDDRLDMIWYLLHYNLRCNMLGRHKPGDIITIKGINIESTCKYCGKKIMLDSQGNWF